MYIVTDEVDVLGYGSSSSSSSSSPPSDSDDQWAGFRNSMLEPSLSGQIISQGGSSSSSFFSSAIGTNAVSGFCLNGTTRLNADANKLSSSVRNHGGGRVSGRTISSSSTSSDGGVASFTRRLSINDSQVLPKINVVSASCLPTHRIRIATSL